MTNETSSSSSSSAIVLQTLKLPFFWRRGTLSAYNTLVFLLEDNACASQAPPRRVPAGVIHLFTRHRRSPSSANSLAAQLLFSHARVVTSSSNFFLWRYCPCQSPTAPSHLERKKWPGKQFSQLPEGGHCSEDGANREADRGQVGVEVRPARDDFPPSLILLPGASFRSEGREMRGEMPPFSPSPTLSKGFFFGLYTFLCAITRRPSIYPPTPSFWRLPRALDSADRY